MKHILAAIISIVFSTAACSQGALAERLPAASITFACRCQQGDVSQRVIEQRGGSGLVIDCSKGQNVVHLSIRPGIHVFSGLPIRSVNEAIYFKIAHMDGRSMESGYVYYSQRRDPLQVEIEPGDMLIFEVKRVGGRP